jgi:hypothetical protein
MHLQISFFLTPVQRNFVTKRPYSRRDLRSEIARGRDHPKRIVDREEDSHAALVGDPELPLGGVRMPGSSLFTVHAKDGLRGFEFRPELDSGCVKSER